MVSRFNRHALVADSGGDGMRSKIGIGFALFVAVALIGGFVAYRQARTWLYSPVASLTSATVYEVPQGAALNGVLRDLEKRGLIRHPRELSLWLRYSRPGFQLKAGE